MKQLITFTALVCLVQLFTGGIAISAEKDDLLGGMQLLPGYQHEKLQGIDSVVGRIVKKKGLTISYEIGGIPKGPFRFGGSFTDRPKNTSKQQLKWYREQMVNGQPMHIAYLKNKTLLVSFPKSIPDKGINFYVREINTMEEMTDVLLMLTTFPEAPVKKEDLKKTGLSPK